MTNQEMRLGDKVVYQIYPRSFQDSDGDGLGDLRGVTSRLDYLRDLGVDLVWLTPFFVSPQYDNGYDVADYRAVDPRFGTMEDFEELVREARGRGMEIMLDMVFNHTSSQHEWFRRALAGDGRYQDFYHFVEGSPDTPPTNWQSKFGGSAWAWSPEVGKWYLHVFDPHQPDLNWENPEVREELADVVRFWKAKGVEGFRFDVVNLVSKPSSWEDDPTGDGRRFYTDGPRIHEHLKDLVRRAGIDGAVTVGEMNSTSLEACKRYTNPAEHELAMAFSFYHLKVDYANGQKWALQEPDIRRLRDLFRTWQEEMTAAGGWNAVFWANHDQPRPVTRFGSAETPELWRASATMLATCTHLMRGTPYIYQGEELGMTNPGFTSIDQYRDVESTNYYRILTEGGMGAEEALRVIGERSRDDGRTPMQWDEGEFAGFSTVEPWIGVAENHTWLNARSQLDDGGSVLAHYKRLIVLRHELGVIQAGSVRFWEEDKLGDGAKKVIAYERELDGTRLLVVCSFDGCEVLGIPATVAGGSRLLIGNYGEPLVRDGHLVLRPYEAFALVWE